MDTQTQENPFAKSGLFVSTADIWTPFKMSFEGFAGAGKTLTMCLIALGIWEAEGKTGNVLLMDTERSAKFIVPFLRQYGLVEGKNLFVTHSRSLARWGEILAMAEKVRGTIFMTDTTTHVYEDMMVQFEKDNGRKVKYPQDAMVIKPMWKEKFSNPFTGAVNTHLLFTGRAAWEYTMDVDEDGKKSFNATGVKMRGDNELAYEPDVVVLMERAQQITDSQVEVARKATIMKDRSRIIDGNFYYFRPMNQWEKGKNPVWEVFEPVYRVLSNGNKTASLQTDADKAMGPLFQKGAGEAWYQQKLRAERMVEEIKGVFDQWGLGGSGGAEKAIRATLYKIIFNNRTTAGLAEMPPEELQAGYNQIEYMARFVSKNMEFVDKTFKANQHEKLNEFLIEARDTYLIESKAPPLENEPEDDIPDFSSNKASSKEPEPKPEPKPESEPLPLAAVSTEEGDPAAKEKILTEMEEAILLGKTEAHTDQIFAGFGAAIAVMDKDSRKRIEKARVNRKKQLRAGGVEARA